MQSAKQVRRRQSSRQNTALKKLITNIIYTALGVAVSRGAIMGNLAPFGVSYAAAVPKNYLLSALTGTAFGYVLLSPTDSFRYIVAVITVGAARWLFSDIERIRKSRLFAPATSFLSVFATGLSLLFGGSGTVDTFAGCVIEAVLSGAVAYFMSGAVRMYHERKSIAACTQQESACLVMTGCVLMLSLGNVAIENVSLGRVIAVIAVLLCARYGGVNGGAVSGIATGAVFSLADISQGFICGGYAFGGLMSGLFAPLGKLGCAISFVIANSIMSLAFGRQNVLASVFIESVAGAAVFMLLPKETGNIISPVFSNDKNASLGETLRKNIVMRLDFASKAISNVKSDVKDVSEKLGEMYSPTFSWVCQNVAEEVCGGCGMKMYCYEHERGVTRDDFFRLEEELQKKTVISDEDVEKAFVKSCCKKGEIADSMNINYRNFVAAQEAQRRIADIRSAVAGQFSGVSDILSDLSKEFKSTMKCDVESADRILNSLDSVGIPARDCICLVNDGGRMSVELEFDDDGEKLPKGFIMREVSKCCGRRFDLPTVMRAGSRVRAALCELPLYDVEIGSDQHIANSGKLCGDCIDYFNDGFGKTYAIVCDGMGTGGRAAVDGNMAVSVMGRLLRSGLSAESSLQVVNTALMIKSEDESLSTVDVTGIDLYTGKVSIKKAGAPMTFIKKGSRVISREMPSLPAGILNDIQFKSDTINLTTGDMVVMVSDGVVTGDEKWLERLIRTWNEGSSQELARAVVEEAIRRRADSRDDDITAVAIRLTDVV